MKCLDARADRQMVVHIEHLQYDPATLVRIIVPTSLPYTNNWSNFERVDGSVQFNEVNYSYVMRKMENGNMIYLCLPNQQKDQISTARNEIIAQSFDLLKNIQSKKHDSGKQNPVKKTIDDFTTNAENAAAAGMQVPMGSHFYQSPCLPAGVMSLPYQPPRA